MYIELLILLNYIFDFIILFSINIILKNNVTLKRLSLGALFGLLVIPFMFLKIPGVINIIIRFIYGLFMVIITFKYKNIIYTFKNTVYLYMLSTIIAGFLYYLSLEINYQIILIILVPLYLYLISFMIRSEKRMSKYQFDVNLRINANNIKLKGYLDTGNSVRDYVLKNKLIIVSKDAINGYLEDRMFYYLNINTVNGRELLRCYKVNEININNKIINKCVIGVSNHLTNSCYDVLIPNYLEEDLC